MKIVEAESQKKWDRFVAGRAEANFLQAWDFYEFHASRGRKIVRRLVLDDDDKVIGAWAGVVEEARRGRHLAVAGGPLIDFDNQKLARKVIEDMAKMGRKRGCVFVRVRPQIEQSSEHEELFRQLGLRAAPMYLSVEHAGVLDLTKSEEEILAGMRQRLRRALRKAEKNQITVETSTDPKDIDEFYKIQLETARRHDFVSFSQDFLQKQFAAFAQNDEAILYTARYEGKILAQNFMIFYGNEASYHYGVSTELGTKLSGAPLLHMEAMREARRRGIKRYNFWGIVPEGATWHRFYGVSTFKRGFGVQELKYLPAQDLVLSWPRYLLNWVVETVRRRVRKV